MGIRQNCSGFTLIEIAVVLTVTALLIGAIAVPLSARIESRRVDDTVRLLELAQEKLLIYASRFGFFPCPADEFSNGQEAKGADHTSGACPVWYGFLPAAALGWTPVDAYGYALDAWGTGGSRIRYAVANDPVDGITNPFTRVNGLANAGVAAVSSASLFRVCGSGTGVNPGVDCGTAPTLAANAAVVVWSVGPNATTGGTSVDEAQNPNPQGGSADRIFVSRTRSSGSGPEYDDLVRWIPGPIVSGRLQVAGVMTPSGSGANGAGGGGGNYAVNDADDADD